jgi:type II secretory pathway component PulF
MAAHGEKTGTEVKRVRRPTKKGASRALVMPDPDSIVPENSAEAVETIPSAQSRISAFSHVTRRQINAFLRQLIMLLEAGTPILKSLRTLESRSRGSLRELIGDIADYVEHGNPLWQALDRYVSKGYFTPVDVNLVKAAEASGNLVPVLQRLVSYRERRELLIKRVRGAMFYPIILLIAAAAVFALITGFVIPQFEQIFQKLNRELPRSTQVVMDISTFIAATWWIILLAIVALIVVYYALSRSSRVWRMRFDRWKLKLPIVGKILQGLAVVEMTRSLSLLLRSGLSMMATLDLARNTIHNQAMAHVVQDVKDSVERGEGIEPPLREEPRVVPPVVTDMLVTGEESGQLEKIADQIADNYEEDVNIRVSTLGDALVPIVTVVLGFIVVGVALAMFLPLIDMVQSVGSPGSM